MAKKLQVFETSQIRVTFDPNICAHSGNCVKGLPAVFDVSRRDWIDPSKASPQDIMKTVAKCPSGALKTALVTSVHHAMSDPPPTPDKPQSTGKVKVTVRPNASLLVEGPFRIVDHEGKLIREGERCSLCRCGHSKNQPFCDASHKESGWCSS